MTGLRIMTFNVYMDGHLDKPGAQATCDSISSSGADIVCLQETNRKWTSVFEAHAGLVDTYPHRCHYHDRFPHGGAAVLSKYPLLGLPGSNRTLTEDDCDEATFSPRVFWGWYGALRVEVQVDAQRWQLMIVHLRAPFPSNPLRVQEQRGREIKTHFDLLMKGSVMQQPTVVLGDFNTKSGPCFEFLKEAGMENAYGGQTSGMYTWKWCMLNNLFDHIWFDTNTVKVIEQARVMYDKRGGSDHFPVICSFEPQA